MRKTFWSMQTRIMYNTWHLCRNPLFLLEDSPFKYQHSIRIKFCIQHRYTSECLQGIPESAAKFHYVIFTQLFKSIILWEILWYHSSFRLSVSVYPSVFVFELFGYIIRSSSRNYFCSLSNRFFLGKKKNEENGLGDALW